MISLSIQDRQLAGNDRVTVAKLLQLGLSSGETRYTMNAAELGTAGLSTNALVALVRAALPRLVGADGVELRPKSFVAKEVTVRDCGEADFTLSFDLTA